MTWFRGTRYGSRTGSHAQFIYMMWWQSARVTQRRECRWNGRSPYPTAVKTPYRPHRGRGHARRLAARGRLPRDRARGRRREGGGARARGRRCRRGAGRRSRPRGGHRRQGQGDGAHGLRSHDTDNLVAPLMLRCSDGQPALPWEDRGEERRKVDERRRRDRERDRKRRRKMARGN